MGHKHHLGGFVSAILAVVVLVACEPPPLELRVSYRADSAGLLLTVASNRTLQRLTISALEPIFVDFHGTRTFTLPWETLEASGDGSVAIEVVATLPELGLPERKEVRVPPEDVKGPLKAKPGVVTTVAATAQPSEPQPIVLLRPETDSRSSTASLTGSFGEYDDVPFEPLQLRFAALPTAQLTHHGQTIPFVDGKATLTLSHADLILDTPPSELVRDTATSSYRVALQQTYNGETRAMAIEIVHGSGVSDLVDTVVRVTQGHPLPPVEGKRRGGVLLIEGGTKPVLRLVDGDEPLRSLAVVGLVTSGAVGRGAIVKTCRYTGNYTQKYHRADRRLVVFNAATGTRVAERLVSGPVPRTCPTMTTTYGDATSGLVPVEPSEADLAAAFRELAAR